MLVRDIDEPRFHAIARGLGHIIKGRTSIGATTKAACAKAVAWVVWAQGTPQPDRRWVFETETAVVTTQSAAVIAVTGLTTSKSGGRGDQPR